jgi:hypothetical protein
LHGVKYGHIQVGSVEGVDVVDVDRIKAPEASSGDYVSFVFAGEHVKGEYHCSDCGYGVTVYRELPRCPMCGGESWEQSTWSPFARARILQ